MKNNTHAEKKSREGKRNLEEKMALSTTVEEEACDNLQGKRYPMLIIKSIII